MPDNSLVFAIGAELSNLRQGANDAKAILGGMEGAADGVSKKLENLGNELIRMGTRIDASIGESLRTFGKSATEEFNKFELSMRQVTSLLGKDGSDAFKGLSEGVKDLAKTMGVDAVGAAQGLYEAISAGVPKENALTFMEIASKTAIAGVTDTKVAVDGLTTVMNAFKGQNVDVKQAADAMFQAVNLGKVTFEQLAASMSVASGQASILGVDYKELLAAGATLTSQGTEISVAFTQLRSAMTALLSPNKEMKALFKEIGVESGEVLIKTYGLEGAFTKLREATQGNNAALNDALGRVEAFNAVVGLTGDHAKTAKEHLDSITASTGAMTDAFGEIEKSGARQMEHLVAQFQALRLEIGERLAGPISNIMKAITPLVDGAINLVEAFSKLPAPIQATGVALLGVLAGIGPVAKGIGELVSTFGFLGNALGSAASGGGVLGGLIALKPLLIATGIAVAGISLYKMVTELTKTNEELDKAYTKFEAFQRTGKGAADVTKDLGDKWATTNKAFSDAVKSAGGLDQLVASAGKGAADAKPHFEDLGLKVTILGKNVDEVKPKIGGIGEASKESAKAAKEAAQAIEQAFSALKIDNPKKELDEMQKAFELLLKTGQITPGSTMYEQALESIRKKSIEVRDSNKEFKDSFDALLDSTQNLPDSFSGIIKSFTDMSIEGQKINLATIEYEKFNKEITKIEGSLLNAKNWPKDIQLLAGPMIAAAEAARVAAEAAKTLGITLEKETQAGVIAAKKAFEDLKATGLATPRDLQFAWDAYIVKKIEAARKAGEEISKDESAQYSAAMKRLQDHNKGATDSWSLMAKQVSTIMTDLGKDIAKTFTDMVLHWDFSAKGFVKIAEAAGQAIVRIFVEQTFSEILKGLKGMEFSFANFGKSVIGVFSSIAKTVGGMFGLGGNAGGAVPKGGTPPSTGGGDGTSAPLGSFTNVFGMITGAVDAITGVLGYLQGRRMEQDIGRIEVTSREIKAETMNLRKDAWDQYNGMYDRLGEVWNSMMQKFDLLIQSVQAGGGTRPIVDAIEQIPKAIDQGTEDVTGAVDNNTDATETVADAVTSTAQSTQSAIGSSATAISRSVAESGASILAGQQESWRGIFNAINNPEYSKGLIKAQMDVFGEVYNWNKTYSPEALKRYAEMVKALQEQLGIADATKGLLIEMAPATERGARALELSVPLNQQTAASTDRTAKAAEQTVTGVGQLGIGIGNALGVIGSNIAEGVNHISNGVAAMSSSLSEPLDRTASATEATVSAVHLTTQTVATGLSALGAAIGTTIRNIPSAPGPIDIAPTLAGGTSPGLSGSERPVDAGSTGAGTSPTALISRSGGDRPVIRPNDTLQSVTVEDTAKIFAGHPGFTNATSWSPFSYQNPTTQAQAQDPLPPFNAAYELSIMQLQNLADSFAEETRLQIEQQKINEANARAAVAAVRKTEKDKLDNEKRLISSLALDAKMFEPIIAAGNLAAADADAMKRLRDSDAATKLRAVGEMPIEPAEPYTGGTLSNIPNDLSQNWLDAISVNTATLQRNTEALRANRELVIRVEAQTSDGRRIAEEIKRYLEDNSAVLA